MRPTKWQGESGGNAMASISRLGKAADIMEKFVTKGKEMR
jgi:hypothetical protein